MGSVQGRSLLQKYQRVANSLTKSKDERAIKKIFQKYDKDEDGKLNKEEALIYIKDVLEISGLAKQIWEDALYLDNPQAYYDDLLEAVYNRMDESGKGFIALSQLIKPNQEFYEFLNSTAEMLEHQFQKQIFEKAIQKDIDEVKKACKDIDFIKGIQFESINEVNKIKFTLQPKKNFIFDFYIRIPHDFPYGYLKCSIPRDAEKMDLDLFEILDRIEKDVNEACKKKEISIGDLFKLFLTEFTRDFSLNLPSDFNIESLKQIWKAQNTDLSDSEIEIEFAKTPLHVDAIEAECVFGHKVTFIPSVNVVRFAIDATALPVQLKEAFGIQNPQEDHALISVQFEDNYLLSEKPPTVKLLPRIVAETAEKVDDSNNSPSKAEAKKGDKKSYKDRHLNTLFSSVMLLVVQHYLAQRWPTILSTEMPELKEINLAAVDQTPAVAPPAPPPAKKYNKFARAPKRPMPAKLAPAKLQPRPRPMAPTVDSDSDSEDSSDDSVLAPYNNNNNVNNNSNNNGGNYNEIGLTVIKVPTEKDDNTNTNYTELEILNNIDTNININNNDGGNNTVTVIDQNNNNKSEEQEKEFIFDVNVGESESVVSETMTEDDKEDEAVLEHLDNSRLAGFLRTSVYDLQKLVNTEAQNLHNQSVQEIRDVLQHGCKQLAIATALSKTKLNPYKAMELYIDAGGEVDVVEKLRDLSERQKISDWKYKNFLLELGCYLTSAVAQLGNVCLVCGKEVAVATRASPLNICTRPTCRYFHWRFFRDIPISISCSAVAPEILMNSSEVDLLISLAYSAASSGRNNLIFNPSPPNMDASTVVNLLNVLPSVEDMKKNCTSEGALKEFLRSKNPTLAENQYNFLFWLLGVDRGKLIRLPFHKRLHVMNTRHQYIMTVICEPERRLKFEEARKKYGSFFAYHGSGMDNWHAIIRAGLKNVSNTSLMTSGAAFGPGVYLAADSDTSFSYARQGVTWCNSKFKSTNTFCLAIVEVAKGPGVPTVAKPYYVVQDDQYVMPRVFLFYGGRKNFFTTPRIGAKALNLHSYFGSQDVLF